ncbi:MAG: hypothetical protein ACFFCQ_17740, partial [Promethearchaeota archaeon]
MLISAFSRNLTTPIFEFDRLKLTISGNFGIVPGSRVDITNTQLDLDRDVCFITYFKIHCNETEILLSELELNATVKRDNELVYEIPSIGYSVESGYYLLIIPIRTLSPGDYKVTITAVVDGSTVSDLITFSIILEEKEEESPTLEAIMVIMVILNLLVIGWTYRIWVKSFT